eukprot:gnl/TRDRNA2_/TRDRNA2_125596_c0_seq1.p1 gnl/TRDRNA2_/TRDRNA2_125596_c0~~gnl/TRDRNA2_/TRDRNA2_125596_c0_seq1.p1  ORF type:complete len:187 (+),score=15.90 gnl/TRDRNA2_/TRDRNA2_125596_c0_seq1:182-742(+)
MREEAAAIRRSGVMKPAVRLGYYGVDSKPGVVLEYDGDLQDDTHPFLSGFTLVMQKHLPAIFQAQFPEASLSSDVCVTNLAVTMGEGSRHPPHFDQQAQLTTILYLQSNWTNRHGGCFRCFESNDRGTRMNVEAADLGSYVDIAPVGGRLVTFWSDSTPHAVQPTSSQSEESHRWAFSIWFLPDHR